MCGEQMADRLLDLVADNLGADVDHYADEDVRTPGAYWFTFTLDDRHYELRVVEVTQR